MRILITNDDGVHAPGLEVLEAIAHALSDDVWVVAPETDQSGVAHSLSLSDPLRLRRIDEKKFAVKGTPTDCVIMGVRNILKDKKPDLVLSGVNRGQNVAEDVTYSGTIAGAMEGVILGVRSIALSQCYGYVTGRTSPHWACARTHGPGLIRKLVAFDLPSNVLLNVNFPDCPPEEVTGVAVAAQGVRSAELLDIDARHDGRGVPYYWIAFARGAYTPGPGTDLEAVAAKKISVTPLRLDLTDRPTMTMLAEQLG
ncbi:MAG: 5'/3'-nucleotidase SurE [Hyphomicrobiales bacterium]|nr:5'/3'-nucleotidase SurE [Hyphomicrobiales bacterium]